MYSYCKQNSCSNCTCAQSVNFLCFHKRKKESILLGLRSWHRLWATCQLYLFQGMAEAFDWGGWNTSYFSTSTYVRYVSFPACEYLQDLIDSVCACACVCMYVCACVCSCVCMFVYVHVCTCVHLNVCICVTMCLHVCMCVHACKWMYRCVHMYTCVYMCACMCVHACVCVCVFMCMYLFAHVCTYGAYVCTCGCACMCVCMSVLVCVCVCMWVCVFYHRWDYINRYYLLKAQKIFWQFPGVCLVCKIRGKFVFKDLSKNGYQMAEETAQLVKHLLLNHGEFRCAAPQSWVWHQMSVNPALGGRDSRTSRAP